jgi:hypothetical protein
LAKASFLSEIMLSCKLVLVMCLFMSVNSKFTPCFSGVHVARSLVFCRSVFVFFFWPLHRLLYTIIWCIFMMSGSFECTWILKSFCHFLGNFQKLLYVYSFVCAVWSQQGYEELIQLASKTIIYYDKMSVQIYIYNMNKLFLHFGISALNEIFLLISLLSLHYFRKQLFYFCLVLSTIFYTSSTKDGPGPPSTNWILCHLVSIVDRVVWV